MSFVIFPPIVIAVKTVSSPQSKIASPISGPKSTYRLSGAKIVNSIGLPGKGLP